MKPNTENLRLGSKKKAEILWMKKDLSWFTKKEWILIGWIQKLQNGYIIKS